MADMRILVSTTVAMVMVITVGGSSSCYTEMGSCFGGNVPMDLDMMIGKRMNKLICAYNSSKQQYIDQLKCTLKILASDICEYVRDPVPWLFVKYDWDDVRRSVDYRCDNLPAVLRVQHCKEKDRDAHNTCMGLDRLSDYKRIQMPQGICKYKEQDFECSNVSVLKGCDADDLAIVVKGYKMLLPDACGFNSTPQKPMSNLLTLFIGLLIVRLF